MRESSEKSKAAGGFQSMDEQMGQWMVSDGL